MLDVRGDVRRDPHGQRLARRIGHERERHDVLVPGGDEGEDHGRHEGRKRERQHDPRERAEPAAAVDRGRFLDLARDRREERAQDPDGERQIEGGVGHDEGCVRVDQPQLEELSVQSDHQRRRREHLRDEDEQEKRRATGEPVARGVVGRRRRGEDDDGRRRQRHHERRAQPTLKARIPENVEKVTETRLERKEPRGRDPELGLWLQSRADHHDVRRQHDEREGDPRAREGGAADDAPAPCSRAHASVSRHDTVRR